jgi:hypothetical protein
LDREAIVESEAQRAAPLTEDAPDQQDSDDERRNTRAESKRRGEQAQGDVAAHHPFA